jgi:hypothetical protein
MDTGHLLQEINNPLPVKEAVGRSDLLLDRLKYGASGERHLGSEESEGFTAAPEES